MNSFDPFGSGRSIPRGTGDCLLLLAAYLAVLVTGSRAAEDSGSHRPNVIVFLADDLGYGDLGCYGRSDIHTPNLDRLAAEGVRLTAHYANGPECTPTRVALLTGRYPHWIGGLECAVGTGNVGRYDDAIRLAERHDLGLPASEPTIGRLLESAGYRTALFGKWHLGYEPKFAPHLHGFEETLYCIGGGMDYFHYLDNVAGYNLFQRGQPVSREGYFTDLITAEATRFLDRHQQQERERPFFLYLPYTAPHSPFQGPADFRPDPLPLDSPLWNQGNAPPDVYRAMIERMDRSIGAVLEALNSAGLADRTLVIFASDNGGTRSARNAPLSGRKGSTMEGGIRVPAIARWPGVIPAGTTSDQVCATFDFTAAIAAAAGVSPPDERPFDGIDILRHVADGARNVDRTLYWRKPRGETIWRAVRQGPLKYVSVQRSDTTQEYLFDLSADLAEQQDLQSDRPEELRRLREQFYEWEELVRRDRRGRDAAGG
jgi:arylsulfatase A-like enzyme